MPSIDRDSSRDSVDRLPHLRHQHSASSDYGKAIVPMWDSSDPERAPPPLPMNPSSPSVAASRPNTSTAIQSAHAALTEKARESGYITNAATKRIESPERSLVKNATHKRMQSLQTGNVRDRSSFLESGNKSPEKKGPSTPITIPREYLFDGRSPERDSRFLLGSPEKEKDRKEERDSSRSATPTPRCESPTKDMPLHVRPSLRRPPQSILGENTPPQSATMLALQNMQIREETSSPLANVTNGSTALVRTPQTFDAISTQILSLTSIATGLQREMAQLSRRSKDNATDLVSLKEATNARDEDIRKSLRELVSNLSEVPSRSSNYLPGTASSLYLDSKAHNSPGSRSLESTRSVKPFSLPRIPSPTSFAASLDRESMASSASYNADGVATIALLEKVIRDMGTRDGQDHLVSQLTDVSKQLTRDGSATAKKLDDLLELIKRGSPQALVSQLGGGDGAGGNKSRNFSFEGAPRLELDFDQPRQGPMTQRVGALLASGGNKENISNGSRASDFVNEDILKLIRSIKDSVAQGGGLTAEVKALVRELRGEVLGMGREIGRKLEQADSANDSGAEKEQVTQVVQEGLEELKEHMDRVLGEHRRQSSSSVTTTAVDYQEIYNAVRSAINEKQKHEQDHGIGKEDIIEAVKEAWENYKPEIEVQQFGLERDELLAALKEGIQEYAPRDVSRGVDGATRDEVFTAVVEGLKHFSPPQVETEASLSREEILDAVRECLEEFEFPAAPQPEPIETGITREDMLEAVTEGLAKFEFQIPATSSRDMVESVTKEDMLEAVTEGLSKFDFQIPTTTSLGENVTKDDVLEAVREALGTFDFPASGTENREIGEAVTKDHVLDAIKEGLHGFDFAANAATSSALSRDLGEGLTRDDVYDAVEDGLKDFKVTSVTRDDVLDAIKEGLDNFDFTVNAANGTALTRDIGEGLTRDDVYNAVKAGLGDGPQISGLGEQVTERLQEIIETMRTEFQSVSEEAKQNVAANGRDTEQLLDATKDGFEKLRQDIEIYVDRAAGIEGQDDALNGMRESLDALRTEIELLSSSNSHGSIETVQSELEQMRETMSTSLVRGSAGADKEEILIALKEGLDTIREDVVRPRDTTESNVSGTGEVLDALHDGLTGLRAEVERIGNKPVDMTVNYEILDTLKLGLEGVRADIDRLRESGHGERAVAEVNEQAVIAADGLKRNDIEHLEVLITQLRIKVEAMESMPPPPPQPVPDMVSRTDLAGVEDMLRNVQESVVSMSTKDRSEDEGSVKREDMEAIENLLRNTKAKVDEMDPEQAVKKDHLDAVELIVAETCEGLNVLKTHLDDVAKRDDVNVVESLVRDILTGLEQVKERVVTDSEDLDKVTKTDVEAVEAVCFDVKSAIDQMILTDIAVLATKEEVQNIEELVKEVKGLIETHTDTNAKSFEERQAETVGVGERVTEVKILLEEFKEAIKEKLEEGAMSTEVLAKLLEPIGETVERNANVHVDVKEMFDTIKSEFEKSNAGVVGSKLEADEKFEKLEALFIDKYGELMLKYDDAQGAAEVKAKLAEEKENGIEIALQGTKTAAEDLRLLTDTLGTTLTESAQKMEEASKTVFDRVDDTYAKVDQIHADAKTDHQLTRDEVAKTMCAVEGVHGHVTEYNPKILESIKDVLLIVGQHYEHSKTTTQTIQEKIEERAVPETPLLKDVPEPEPYDDGRVHEKLDKLVDHMHTAGKSFAQLDMLDKIHQQVMQTAAEVSQFVTAQTQRIADDHEDKEKAVEAATIALEKRLAQKELVEATVVGLRDEEERLKESVAILRAEQEDLAHQKMRLSKDVSSLETALRIRREELHIMESRAEGLERRILEGVIDHSRALLISKSNKGRDAMSRKRVPSHATSTTGSMVSGLSSMSGLSRASSATQSAVNMAMSGNRAMVSVPINNPAGASRRILSLNQITHNVPSGGFTRSHSVKTPGGAGLRKSSWGGSRSQKYGELNKENLALRETAEGEEDVGDENMGEREMEMEKDRRSSNGTTVLTSNLTESTIDEGTEWTGSIDGDESHSEEESEVGQGIVVYEPAGEVV